MRFNPLLILAVLVATACGASRGALQSQPRTLFNGKDLSGWHVDVPASDSNARLRNPFVVRNGLLVFAVAHVVAVFYYRKIG